MTVRLISSQCDVCESNINFKFQEGPLEKYPLYFNCPACLTKNTGEIHRLPSRWEINIDNVNVLDEYNFAPDFLIIISGEFPATKMLIHEDSKKFKLATSISPFLKHHPRGESAEEIYFRLQKVIPNIVEKDWKIIERIAYLFFNKKSEYIEKEIDKLRSSQNFNISEYELPRSVKDLVATIPRSFNQFNNIYKISTEAIFQEINNQRAEDESNYIAFLNSFSQEKIEHILKNSFEIINNFIKNYRLFLPVIYLEGNSKGVEEIKEFEGLTTVSIDELDKFYLFAYESLVECSELLITIDNYITKGKHNIYPIMSIEKFPKLKTQYDFRRLTKGNRLKVLAHTDNKISPIFNGLLNPTLRNAIGHNNYHYEQNTQKIQYNNSELYLIEFANICYQLIKISVYIWDIGFEFMRLKVEHNNQSKWIKS